MGWMKGWSPLWKLLTGSEWGSIQKGSADRWKQMRKFKDQGPQGYSHRTRSRAGRNEDRNPVVELATRKIAMGTSNPNRNDRISRMAKEGSDEYSDLTLHTEPKLTMKAFSACLT